MATAPSDALFEKAAQLRAEGLSREAVARALYRTASRLDHRRREHPVRWPAASKPCQRETLSDAAAAYESDSFVSGVAERSGSSECLGRRRRRCPRRLRSVERVADVGLG